MHTNVAEQLLRSATTHIVHRVNHKHTHLFEVPYMHTLLHVRYIYQAVICHLLDLDI
jgi:hypothetical protein